VKSIFPSALTIAGVEGKMPVVYESVTRSRSALRPAGQVLYLAKGRAERRASNEVATEVRSLTRCDEMRFGCGRPSARLVRKTA
jgi:hypothetical protein